MIKKYLFFYERLSKEDGDDESCSIGNQRRLLQRFQKEKDEFSDYEVKEFIDLVQSGDRESSVNSHLNSLITLEIIDEVRRQLGVVYPADKN